ncbi:MAG: N-acetyltransferase [Planctomycetes bacterium]|nr:N-acetyltransferase [Planctomycetota bacterium]MBL7107147.1 N-acetyltransferase [Phycisphaerae bacterium]
MEIRKAKISDVKSISKLINFYAEQDQMLHRPLADIYENLQRFLIAELDGNVIGCCALSIIWSDLAEIKSLAIDQNHKSKRIGSALVQAAINFAAELGIEKVFALTLEKDFFEKNGFEQVDTNSLPMKVWSDCAKCPKQDHCDEIAVIKYI